MPPSWRLPRSRALGRWALFLLVLAVYVLTTTLPYPPKSLLPTSLRPQTRTTPEGTSGFHWPFVAQLVEAILPSTDGVETSLGDVDVKYTLLAEKCPSLAAVWMPVRPPLVAAAEGAPTPSDSPRFGKAKARGLGFVRASVGVRTCFELLAVDKLGLRLDVGPIQRAFFQVILRLDLGKPMPPVHVAADVQYMPESSTHVVCYTPVVAGQYKLWVLLLFENAWRVASYVDQRNSAGYMFHKVVGQVRVNVSGMPGQGLDRVLVAAASSKKPLAPFKRSLPSCSFDLIRDSGNQGSWVGQHWLPSACDNELVGSEDILRFLDGKRVAFIGDSEARYTFNMLRRWLSFNSTQAFLQYAQSKPRFVNVVHLHHSPHEVLPFDVETCQVITREVPLENGKLTFYGTVHSGFGQYLVEVPSAQAKGVTYSFNITYIVQLGATLPVSQEWMENSTITGGATVSKDDAPYDLAFVSSGLHDVSRFQNSTSFAAAFKRLLPGLRSLVKSPSSVVFFGMWSADELHKKPGWRHSSNNVRISEFEAAQKLALQEEGFPNFISTRLMTEARPDLCIDSTHYSWPITVAMLNLAFTSLM